MNVKGNKNYFTLKVNLTRMRCCFVGIKGKKVKKIRIVPTKCKRNDNESIYMEYKNNI